MTPRDIPAVKAVLRGASQAGLRDLAARALACGTAEEVRALEAELVAPPAQPVAA
jgi:multiphosphoryl transfer protein